MLHRKVTGVKTSFELEFGEEANVVRFEIYMREGKKKRRAIRHNSVESEFDFQ